MVFNDVHNSLSLVPMTPQTNRPHEPLFCFIKIILTITKIFKAVFSFQDSLSKRLCFRLYCDFHMHHPSHSPPVVQPNNTLQYDVFYSTAPWLTQLVAGLLPPRPGFLPRRSVMIFVVDRFALKQIPFKLLYFLQLLAHQSSIFIHLSVTDAI
jgi:hypothetical protein